MIVGKRVFEMYLKPHPTKQQTVFSLLMWKKKEIAGALGFLRKLSKTQKITGRRITQWMLPTTESGGVSLDLITVVVERPG